METMEMSMILKPEAVKVLSAVSSKKRLFHELGMIAETAYGVNHAEAIDALQERESLGPTGVGHGVALPHARLEGLDNVVGAFVLLEKPIAPRFTINFKEVVPLASLTKVRIDKLSWFPQALSVTPLWRLLKSIN